MAIFPARPALVCALLTLCVACSDDDPAGSGGAGVGGAGGDGAGGGATSVGGSGGSGGTTSGGGSGGGSACPTGLFDGTSCEGFLDGCYAPDTTGTCTDSGTELSWSDGHTIVRVGGDPGLYGPDDTTPCITLAFDVNTNTSTLTKVSSGETLLNQDLGNGQILITCPMGDEHTFTADELDQDNLCKGIACPP